MMASAAVYAGAFRRDGVFSLKNQAKPVERLVDATIAAGSSLVLFKLAERLPAVRELLTQRLKAKFNNELTLDDLIQKAKSDANWGQQELNFYLGQSHMPPHGSIYSRNQPIWSRTKTLNFMGNLIKHGEKHSVEFPEMFPHEPTYYAQFAHDFRSNMPVGRAHPVSV